MEYLDIVDENGTPIGQSAARNIVHKEGLCHRTAHIWILNGNKVLLQKRAMVKESFPGKYDTSSAGHISAGQEPLEAALRELEEELGICAKGEELKFISTFHNQYEMMFHGSLFKDNEIIFLYVYEKNVDIESLTLQKEELDSVEWFDMDELSLFLEKKDPRFCVPYQGFQIVKNYLKQKI